VTTGEHASTLEHLAEMDRLLRDIQLELGPGREAPPVLEATPSAASATTPPEPAPPEPAPPEAGPPEADAPPSGQASEPRGAGDQVYALSQLAARLLASMRELLDGYEQFLVQIPSAGPPVPARPPAPARLPEAARPPEPARRQAPRRDVPDVTVAAGPFLSIDALRSFEHAVSRLPSVRDVAVRGYEGADRAIIEVRLDRNGG
jgi:hypothetical protein